MYIGAKEKFCNTIRKSLTTKVFNSNTTTDTHNALISSVVTARNTLPKIDKRKPIYPWDDNHELKRLIDQRNGGNTSRNGQRETKILTQKIKKLVNKLRNQYFGNIGSQINEAKQNREIVNMWRKAKNHDKIIKSRPKLTTCCGLKEHFQSHFNPDHSDLTIPKDIEHPPEYIISLRNTAAKINNSEPTNTEISHAIKSLKANKSSLDVEAEALKLAITVAEFSDSFKNFITQVWNEKNIPNQWDVSRITALWKQKGSPQDPKMYRGIAIGSIVVKIIMNNHSEKIIYIL